MELFECSSPKYLIDEIESFQDKLKPDSNHKFESIIITKKQKNFIIENNKRFHKEFQKAYIENIELKKKFNEINSEKLRLKEKIIRLEKKMKLLDKVSKNEINNNGVYVNNKYKNIVSYSDKRKRIRRKKTEIVNKYNCTYPDCVKSYPSNSSLNKHIKLKKKKKNNKCLTEENRK